MDRSTVVRVTFVGGPLHGTSEEILAPQESFWRYANQVGAVLYGRRWVSIIEGVDPARAVYAPVGMSSNAYRDMLAKVFGIDHPAHSA